MKSAILDACSNGDKAWEYADHIDTSEQRCYMALLVREVRVTHRPPTRAS